MNKSGLFAAMISGLLLLGSTAYAQKMTSLYERLGTYSGISAVLNTFADKLFADKRINDFF